MQVLDAPVDRRQAEHPFVHRFRAGRVPRRGEFRQMAVTRRSNRAVTAEEVELLTVPSDLGEYKDAIANALINGTKRFVESEPEKN